MTPLALNKRLLNIIIPIWSYICSKIVSHFVLRLVILVLNKLQSFNHYEKDKSESTPSSYNLIFQNFFWKRCTVLPVVTQIQTLGS